MGVHVCVYVCGWCMVVCMCVALCGGCGCVCCILFCWHCVHMYMYVCNYYCCWVKCPITFHYPVLFLWYVRGSDGVMLRGEGYGVGGSGVVAIYWLGGGTCIFWRPSPPGVTAQATLIRMSK